MPQRIGLFSLVGVTLLILANMGRQHLSQPAQITFEKQPVMTSALSVSPTEPGSPLQKSADPEPTEETQASPESPKELVV
ncbi:MAG TPA: hypothetical protein VEX38_04200, partial [Fimbriimonadaceae bacterium]|nr:hypothetical protein [Fimbriimonadaceae bacterium]